MALVQMNFESEYLQSNHEISVILPDKPRSLTPAQFTAAGKKYPVVWLLHGTFGDHSDWILQEQRGTVRLRAGCDRGICQRP